MALTQLKTGAIADDAVTTDKLANAINTERTANTAKVSTTINNNADNRVITGSGTANTLEGEANLTFSSNTLTVHEASLKGNQLLFGPSGTAYIDHSTTGQDIQFRTSVSSSQDTTGPTIKSNGNIGFATAKGLEFQNSVTVKEASSNLNIDIAAGNNNIDFKSGGTAFLKLRGTNGNVEVVNGNVEIGTAGKGIHFHNYGTGTGIDSNLLDDYEEGTWTPVMKKYDSSNNSWVNATMTSNGTVQYAKYTKVGNKVQVYLFWNGWQQSDASYCVIGGLPFASIGGGVIVPSYNDCFANPQDQGGLIGHNSTNVSFYYNRSNWNAWSSSSGRNLYFGGFYFTA